MLICMQIFEISVFGGTDNERVDGILTGEPELMRLAMTLAKNKKKIFYVLGRWYDLCILSCSHPSKKYPALKKDVLDYSDLAGCLESR